MKESNQSLVSVVIPCYNHEKFVQDCIKSVIDQTYQNIELIIIDDGSKDQSVEKIKEMVGLCNKRFTNFDFRYRPNKGLTHTLNESLDWVKGEFLILIASDDYMTSDRVEIQVEILRNNPEYYACSGSQLKIDENGCKLEYKFQNNLIKKNIVKDRKNIFKSSNNIYSPTTMFRTSVIKDLGGYNPNILIEDLYIFYKAALNDFKHLQVTNVFTYYRVHGSNNHKRYIWMHENKMKILEEFKFFDEYDDIKKLFVSEGFYSISRYSSNKYAYNIFKQYKKFIFFKYLIVGFLFLLLKR